ncbi:MAG: tripartite tricarboxylate transporter TctB family protein [Gammaproteobacteria bacterium]|jgi:putative tricarboxylic transport membrane protein|uniref:tripartite tricarboxylate transporter TctB family protein n=1 Tax=Stutzerimonas xanthomarina TaxID=271420 RepID=UPI00190A1117|nr:tripartite tricarboxylate transporter TctB family protein [Stutzerimonas xanthomarina]MBU0811976.1 tripartite tricarboxylate transporter TctB family protein [Gammaproteobacteria bacterium]MBK3845784.1 tripartite tricarboxylate transporter TctB family protein [Stutzerimonas xanthomarina]MBU0852044.1 tripartite tricarboxylate transporter TctB family protein [Gammaproteobacteria bacterium]MBU1300831.1 tripartite tricarboxylate transporter TctB family protein [Gammaproteobacteria bacterium]MBU1|tara:strand:- start:3659 stop:4147 length:489 start_codon:yes stop_codon:yes gene_type:complete
MDTYKRKELLVGALMLGAGLFYLFLTINLPRKGFIDASTVPYVLSVGLCLLGVLQLLTATKATQPPVDPDADADPSAATPPDYSTVFKTLGLIAVYVALLQKVGFPIMTVLYLYAQFIIITPREQKINHITYIVIAVITSALIFFTFRQGFDLMLPTGFLKI